MAKVDQVLTLEPAHELRFRGPFTDVVNSELKLYNPSDKRVCFKVKTTAPKKYCVRPNSGIIDPGQSVHVAVMLQPFNYDPTEKNKHKFMVQTMFCTDGQAESAESLWKDATPDKLMDSKLKCVFEVLVDDGIQNNLDTTTEGQDDNVKVANISAKTFEDAEPAAATPKVNNLEADVRKAQEEVRRIEAERNTLRDENRHLKEEGVRLRKVAMSDTVSSTPKVAPSVVSSQENNDTTLSQIPSVAYLVIALILGLIFGKFVF